MGRKKVCYDSSVLLAAGLTETQLVTGADHVQVEVACRESDTPIVQSTCWPSSTSGLSLRHVNLLQLGLLASMKLIEADLEDTKTRPRAVRDPRRWY